MKKIRMPKVPARNWPELPTSSECSTAPRKPNTKPTATARPAAISRLRRSLFMGVFSGLLKRELRTLSEGLRRINASAVRDRTRRASEDQEERPRQRNAGNFMEALARRVIQALRFARRSAVAQCLCLDQLDEQGVGRVRPCALQQQRPGLLDELAGGKRLTQ